MSATARSRRFLWTALLSVAFGVVLCVGAAGALADEPSPLARGPHISGVVRYQPKAAPAPGAGTPVSCSTPGSGNFKTDCKGGGRPVNETAIATNGSTYVAGANDYNSYNGQGQDGYYWSSDGSHWNDAGPIDVFPHSMNNAGGDPGVAIDSSGVVYCSSIFFNYNNCGVGGVELLRRDPGTGSWSYYQIAANSRSGFQDKPAIALDSAGHRAYVSWTQFGSCSGWNVTSPIKIAVFPDGSRSVVPATILVAPGSTYSQGSSIAADGSGGFWLAWEEWPGNGSSSQIRLAHYTSGAWATLSGTNKWLTISPAGFSDLPSPLPGFKFRNDSFPALAVVGGQPKVVWAAYSNGSGPGRVYLWSGSSATKVADSGGDQFFPSIASDGSFTRSSTTGGASTVSVGLANGSATGGGTCVGSTGNVDYNNTGFPKTASFTTTSLTTQVTVPICGDLYFEGNETFTATLSGATNGTIGAKSSATVTIQDNDPQPTLAVNDPTAVNEGQDVVFTVSLTGLHAVPVSVHWATSDGTGTAGDDYTAPLATSSGLRATTLRRTSPSTRSTT